MMLLTYFFYINLYNEIYIFSFQEFSLTRFSGMMLYSQLDFFGHVEIHGIAKVVLQLLISSLPVS
jgi:hypothetical protein